MNSISKWFTKNRIKIFVFTFSLLMTIIIVGEYFFSIEPIRKLSLKFIDQNFSERGEMNISDSADVVILEINHETDEQIPPPYSNPYPRWFYAKVIENLNEAGAKIIGIDVVFSNPDYRYKEKNDELLFESIRKHRNVVLAGKIDIAEEAKQENVADYNNSSSVGVIRNKFENFENIFFEADSLIGLVQTLRDYDGVLRSYLPYVYSEVASKKFIPTFSFAVLNKYFDLPNFYTAKSIGNNYLYNKISIPKYNDYSVLVNFYGPDATFKRIKFIDVLDDKDFKTKTELELGEDINTWDDPDFGLLHSGIFKDKIVLIGSTEPEDRDYFQVSFQKKGVDVKNQMYGVEYHANMIQNVIWNDFISVQSKTSEILSLIITFCIVFWLSVFLKELKVKSHWLVELLNAFLILLILYGLYELNFILFNYYKTIFSFIPNVLGVLIAYFSVTSFYFFSERSQKKLIKGMFSHYVTGDLVNELLNNPEKLKLGGEKKNLTILFSDIASFTTFSEKLSPSELVNFINGYLNEMTKIVLTNKGTLDKYIGDAVMAFWGAPIDVEEKELAACRAALQMQSRLIELRNSWQLPEAKHLNVRIGINCGEVVVGNIGGETRFDYTVMGDNVNLASRLEGANKQYGTNIMIGENVFNAIQRKILVRELDNIRVKGKEKPTKVYELISLAEDENGIKKLDELEKYFSGLSLYKEKQFSEALKMFMAQYELNSDSPSIVYIERCKYYIENPPDETWDCVFTMKTK